jgi:hypothetical protein
MRQLLLSFMLFGLSCSDSNVSNSQKKIDSDTTPKPDLNGKVLNTPPPNATDTGYLLTNRSDSFLQTMRVFYLNDTTIKFTLTTYNLINKKTSSLSGITERDELDDKDMESDFGNDGFSFFYDWWHYVNGKCALAMRIADSAKYIRIYEFKCKSLHDPTCPFETNGVLQRADINY